MEISGLEEINDNILYLLCYMISKEMGDINYNLLSFDNEFIETCDNAGKFFNYEMHFIDYDYILYLLKNNSFKDKTPKPLKKPSIKTYQFDFDENRTEQVLITYRHKLDSYTENQRDFISLINKMEDEGVFSPWDGREINRDYYDGNTNDYYIDKNSIEEI